MAFPRHRRSLAVVTALAVGAGLATTAGPAFADPDTLRLAVQGDDVASMQRNLVITGFLRAPFATGRFQPETETALSHYQNATGLTRTGQADPKTQAKLAADVAEITTNLVAAIGSSGAQVQKLQTQLATVGQLRAGEITGTFGASTQAALTRYQKAAYLLETGTADRVTVARLEQSAADIINRPVLVPGQRSNAVRSHQIKLSVAGWLPSHHISGVYDKNFTAAITRYQKAAHLVPTGAMDAITYGRIEQSYRDVWNPAIRGGSTDPAVRRAQTQLAVLRTIAPAAVTGRFDAATAKGVLAFQRAQRLYPGGRLDAVTRRKIDQVYRQVASKPGVTIGSRGKNVTTVLTQLNTIGYRTSISPTFTRHSAAAVKRFQTSVGLYPTGAVDMHTHKALSQAYTKQLAVIEQAKKAAAAAADSLKLDPRCMVGRKICANKTTRKLSWVVDGKVIRTFDARYGMPSHDTREGVFPVYAKYVNSWSYLYHVNMPYSMYFSGGQAIHYSAQFASVGYTMSGSHGCVNLRDYQGIAWLYSQVRVGDQVVVYK